MTSAGGSEAILMDLGGRSGKRDLMEGLFQGCGGAIEDVSFMAREWKDWREKERSSSVEDYSVL